MMIFFNFFLFLPFKMSEDFRKPEFVKRNELAYYDLDTPLNVIVANGAVQERSNYRFVVDNSSETNPIDWYNVFLEISFRVSKIANNDNIAAANNATANFCASTNANTFIRSIEVECDGISVYDNQRANESANVLTLLNFSKSYADSIGQDQFFFVDTKTGGAEPRNTDATAAAYNEAFKKRKAEIAGGSVVNASIPLNQFSYFKAFKNQIHPNLKTTIILTLANKNDIILRHADADASRVVFTKMRLWCPKLIFNGNALDKIAASYLKPQKWTFIREYHDTLETEATSAYFRISAGIRRPRHVLVWATPAADYGNQEANIFVSKLFAIGTNGRHFTKAQLEVNNSIYYPQLDFTSSDASRLFRALMSFNSKYNVFHSGTIINRENFKNIFGFLHFDLRNQAEDIKNSAVSLTFRYELNGAPGARYTLHGLVLHEKDIELVSSSGKLLVKA